MTQVRRTNNFNLIRLVLAVMVLLSHGFELIDGNRSREILTRIFGSISFGELAVDGFFVVSGYLISSSYLSDPDAFSFLTKRIIRIYPGFIVACLVCLLLVGPLAGGNPLYFSQINGFEFIKNVATLQVIASPMVFPGSYYPSLNGSLWTIRWEFFCYILVLVLGKLKFFQHRFASIGLLVIAWIGLILTSSHSQEGTLYSLFRFTAFYMSGVCYNLFESRLPKNSISMIFMIVCLIVSLNFRIYSQAFLVLSLAYVLIGFGNRKFGFTDFISKMPDVSYGTYLYGWPIQKILINYFGFSSPYIVIPLSIVGAMALGYLSYQAVEKYFTVKNLNLFWLKATKKAANM